MDADGPQLATPFDEDARTTIAPVWHTAVLLAGIAAIAIHGASRLPAAANLNRLATYGTAAATEAALLAWVAFGLRLRGIPFRSLTGKISGGLLAIGKDMGAALLFWIAALILLGSVGVVWSRVEAAVEHRQFAPPSGEPLQVDPSQREALRVLAQLAPANGEEAAAWVLLCLLVGIAEETIFRGYLQRQFAAWARGKVAAGVIFSALIFGSAHAYQGARNMVLLTVFGVLFSVLALVRRNLRACAFAHSWHDLIAGLALALLKSHGMIG